MDRRKLSVRFFLLMLFLSCVVSLLQPSSDVKFYECFDEVFEGRWTVSEKEDYKGLGLLALQAHYPKMKAPPCNVFDAKSQCTQLHGGNAALFYIGLYLIAIGTAGVKAGLPSHGADQFEDDDAKEVQQKSTFFNWFLLALCLGGAVSLTVFVYVEANKGWDWGFSLSTLAMLLGILLLLSGLPWYRIHVVRGSSAITEIIQVYVAAILNSKLSLPENSAELYEINEDKEPAIESDLLPHIDDFRGRHDGLFIKE